MRTISQFKILGLATLLFFASCEDNNEQVDDSLANSTCELNFESTLIENDSENEADYIFEANELESNSSVVYSWSIDGIDVQESSNTLAYVFIENGTYNVCVFSETPECPNGVTSCQEITVNSLPTVTIDECPVISFETILQNSVYNFTASSNIPLDARYSWSINGEFIDNDTTIENSNNFTFDFPENGTYEVCVFVETPNCPLGVQYCQTLEVANIVDGTLPVFDITVTNPVQDRSLETCNDLTYNYVRSNGNTFTLSVNNADELGVNGGFSWFINDDFIGSGATIDYEFVDNGTYTICVFQETPVCPNGVSYCRDFIVANLIIN